MAGYIAGRPCVFRGEKYLIGEEIPHEAVDPRREKALIDSGHINKIPDDQNEQVNTGLADCYVEDLKIIVPVAKNEDGSTEAVALTTIEINSVFAVWFENTEGAKDIIESVENPDVLSVMKIKETRKGVSEAIEKRLEELPQADEIIEEAGDA